MQMTTQIRRQAFRVLWILAFVFLLNPSLCAATQNVTLVWNASSAPDLAGYRLYYGISSRNYNTINDVGNVTTKQVLGLEVGATYFFAVTAYSTAALESDYSNELIFTAGAANQPPIASSQSVSTSRNTPLNIVLLGSDPEGSSLTFAIVTLPTNGTLTGSGANRTYTPAFNFAGNDSFTFKVNDGSLDSATATVGVTIIDVAVSPPQASPQSVVTAEDSPLSITLSGTDPQGLPLTFSVFTEPVNGNLSGTAPAVTYLPHANVSGNDSFTFKVNNGILDSQPATVSITITAVNDAPLAHSQAFTTAENTPVNITLTGSDAEGSPLNYLVLGAPTKGTLLGAPPLLIYTPSAGQTGTDAFTFKVNDGALDSTPATINITINLNLPPVLQTIADKTVDEETAVAFQVVATDPNLPAQTLTFRLAPGAPAGAAINPNTGIFNWTPNEDQGPGNYSITVEASDNASPPLSSSQTFQVNVREVNKKPALQPIPDKTVVLGQTLIFTVVASDADLPGNNLVFVLDGQLPFGASVNLTSGVFTWTPTQSQASERHFATIRVFDDGTPLLHEGQTFQISVIQPPQIQAADSGVQNGIFTLAWSTQAGKLYRVLFKNSLSETTWTTLREVTAGGPLTTITDPIGVSPQRYYLIQLLN